MNSSHYKQFSYYLLSISVYFYSSHLVFIGLDRKNLCVTPGCINAAASILNRMDTTIKPCDNFYDFACGKFVKDTLATIPDDKLTVDMFSSVSDRIELQLKAIVNEPIRANESKAFTLAKRLNASCMNRTAVEIFALKKMNEILDSYGGWPVIKGINWNENAFELINVIGKMRATGLATSYLFSLSIGANFKNSSMRTLRVIDYSLTQYLFDNEIFFSFCFQMSIDRSTGIWFNSSIFIR